MMKTEQFASEFKRRFTEQASERVIPPKCADCGLLCWVGEMTSCMATFTVMPTETPPIACPLRGQVRDLLVAADSIIWDLLGDN